MKQIFFCILSLVCLQAFSQFPLYTVMPLNVSSVAFGDTLLNTPDILRQQGIKKVSVLQTRSGIKSYWKNEYDVMNGQVVSRRSCFRRSPGNDSGFCIARDTTLYDSYGHLEEYWAGNSKEESFVHYLVQHFLGGKTTHTWIMKDQRVAPDTQVYHLYYNTDGQLIRRQQEKGQYRVDATLYYNEDGFLDIIRHDNPAWGSYVFTRKKKGSNTEIATETHNSSYRWVYNGKGQCLSSHWSIKKTETDQGKPLFSDIAYSYNDDGTLAKVVEKGGNGISTIVYSYTK